ncbi:hypothetical protein F5887DRAFT_1059940 [Amanita rubescens]|nr:hypothetical protein F5887DRAFT_1059940 [Amanita rubescens]
MLSYALSTASTYFHLPIDEEEDADIEKYQRKYLTWVAEPPRSSPPAGAVSSSPTRNHEHRTAILKQIIACNDLYDILGIPKSVSLDRMMLRRAYLSRSKACHPDKFPDDPDATLAFQKVALAYDVLSKPSSKRLYDAKASPNYEAFTPRPANYAEDTLRGVVLAAFNDFLEGDLEIVRTLLKAVHDTNPSLGLGEDGISSIMEALRAIRERALTCRTCICALHAEITRLLEIKNAFQKLSYFDIMSRSRLTIQLARITVTLPISLENALRGQENKNTSQETGKTLFPRQLKFLIHGVDLVLERMERLLR